MKNKPRDSHFVGTDHRTEKTLSSFRSANPGSASRAHTRLVVFLGRLPDTANAKAPWLLV